MQMSMGVGRLTSEDLSNRLRQFDHLRNNRGVMVLANEDRPAIMRNCPNCGAPSQPNCCTYCHSATESGLAVINPGRWLHSTHGEIVRDLLTMIGATPDRVIELPAVDYAQLGRVNDWNMTVAESVARELPDVTIKVADRRS